MVQIYHGLGGNQTNGLKRSQSESSLCGLGREHSADSQPGPDRETGELFIGCEKEGKADRGGACGQGDFAFSNEPDRKLTRLRDES